MARFGNSQLDIGKLEIRTAVEGGRCEAFFVPNESPDKDSLAHQRLMKGVKLVELEPQSGIVKIHPINTLSTYEEYLGPKYKQIHTLTLEVSLLEDFPYASDVNLILEMLPPGFVKDYAYGLGLLKDCNRLIRLIEDNTLCDEIIFIEGRGVRIDGNKFFLGLSRFGEIWTEIRRINDRSNRAASRVKDAFVRNNLAATIGISTAGFSLGRHPDSRVIAKAAAGVEELSDVERDALIDVVSSESTALAATAPQKFYKLKRDIEIVSLDRLIKVYEESLNQNRGEAYWQKFFEDNMFALQQVFGVPMVSVQPGASVGGRGLSGGGDKIADYLFKNSLTNNVALVEIKKPNTLLLEAREYRQGVFGPSKELNGAVGQVLDQAHNLMKHFTSLKEASRQWDLESYAISCFVVAGRTPPTDDCARQKSFELYRANSRSVTIVTYDEILERLKLLRSFLAPIKSSTEEV